MIRRRDLAVGMAAVAGAIPGAASAGATRGTVRREVLRSAAVPGEVPVSIYLPAPASARPLPLLLLLHGGNGDERDLLRFVPAIDRAIGDGRLPPLAIAMPAARRSLYMDFRDGSQRWESFILAELLPFLRRHPAIAADRGRTFVGGVSMGGLGSLRVAFKHPEIFGGVAALEPAIEPALSWADVGPRVKFWRSDETIAPMFGSPVDLAYWAANNPATIAARDPARLIGLPIYLDVGDQDMLYLNQGAEFLHRILFDAGIGHEYRLVHGADHVGPSLVPRLIDALGFLGRLIRPPGWIDQSVLNARAVYDAMKRAAGLPLDHADPRRIHGL